MDGESLRTPELNRSVDLDTPPLPNWESFRFAGVVDNLNLNFFTGTMLKPQNLSEIGAYYCASANSMQCLQEKATPLRLVRTRSSLHSRLVAEISELSGLVLLFWCTALSSRISVNLFKISSHG